MCGNYIINSNSWCSATRKRKNEYCCVYVTHAMTWRGHIIKFYSIHHPCTHNVPSVMNNMIWIITLCKHKQPIRIFALSCEMTSWIQEHFGWENWLKKFPELYRGCLLLVLHKLLWSCPNRMHLNTKESQQSNAIHEHLRGVWNL